MIAPSPSKCALATMVECAPRSTLTSPACALRSDGGAESWPSSSSRSKATCNAVALAPCLRIRSKTARPLSSQTIASPSTTHDFAGSAATASLMNGSRSEKSWPVSGNQPDAVSIPERDEPEPVVLDFVTPTRASDGFFAGRGRQGSMRSEGRRLRSRNILPPM